MKIKKAVIPVAGFGTRFLPATKAQPKEMLALVDKPVLQYIVEEMAKAGVTEIVLVTDQNKRAIEDHFDSSFELEHRLLRDGKEASYNQIKEISNLAKFIYIRQKEALGPGHALLCAKEIVGSEPFAFAYGDDIISSEIPAIGQMIETFEKYKSPIIGVVEVPWEKTKKYGVIEPEEIEEKVCRVKNIVEKPDPGKAPSNLINPGRYILTPKIFSYLEKIQPGKGGEIWLSDAISELTKNEDVFAHKIDGLYFDCGDKLEFLKATIHFALRHPELNGAFKNFLETFNF